MKIKILDDGHIVYTGENTFVLGWAGIVAVGEGEGRLVLNFDVSRRLPADQREEARPHLVSFVRDMVESLTKVADLVEAGEMMPSTFPNQKGD